MRLPISSAGLAILVLLLACGSDVPRDTGTVRLANQAEYEDLPALRMKPGELVCATEVTACMPYRGGAVAISDSGSVAYGGLMNTWQVYLVQHGTRRSQTVGRTGSGPGEYQSVLALGFTPANTLRAFDILQRRVIEFGTDGSI